MRIVVCLDLRRPRLFRSSRIRNKSRCRHSWASGYSAGKRVAGGREGRVSGRKRGRVADGGRRREKFGGKVIGDSEGDEKTRKYGILEFMREKVKVLEGK